MPEEVKKSLIGDLAGLSEPIKKLVEVVSAGLGRVTGSMWLDKRDADNEAYKILTVGGAQTQVAIDRMKAVAAMGSGSTPQVQKLTLAGNEVNAELSDGQQAVLALKERSDNRAEYQNLLHQLNIEQTVSFAAEELAKEGTVVSEEPLDENWIARFFDVAQNISGDDIQSIWGKLLSGEIKKTHSYSLRTLDILKNLNQKEAKLFEIICQYKITIKYLKTPTSNFILNPWFSQQDYAKYDYTLFDIKTLIDCGLMHPSYNMAVQIPIKKDETSRLSFRVADEVLSLQGLSNADISINLPAFHLTESGNEISSLINAIAPIEYLKNIAKYFVSAGFVGKHAKFLEWEEKGMTFHEPLIDL